MQQLATLPSSTVMPLYVTSCAAARTAPSAAASETSRASKAAPSPDASRSVSTDEARFSDAYHSCYVLSGLSAAQHQWDLVEARPDPILLGGDKWTFTPYLRGEQVFDEGDRVGAIHPVYAIPQHSIQDVQAYFSAQKGF